VEKLLPLWGSEVGIDDALELLGPGFKDRRVRAFAVKRLERADDDVSFDTLCNVSGADNLGTPTISITARSSSPL
jgi:hypothetical protein